MNPTTKPTNQDSLDAVFGGRVMLWQGRQGYRCSVDPLLLAWFVQGHHSRVMDLGCGVGVLGLLLLEQHKAVSVTGLERQEALVERARRSVTENGRDGSMNLVHGDLRDEALLDGMGSFDLVLANPPFFKQDSGRVNPVEEVRNARHEDHGGISAFCRAASRLLKPKGRASFVFPSARLVDLMDTLLRHGLRPCRMRLVHPRAGKPANLVLLEARKGTQDALVCEAPLLLADHQGEESQEALALQGRVPWP